MASKEDWVKQKTKERMSEAAKEYFRTKTKDTKPNLIFEKLYGDKKLARKIEQSPFEKQRRHATPN